MSLSARNEKYRNKMLEMPSICVERAQYMTESYRKTEALPDVMRRAEALTHIFKNMTIRVNPDELLAGDFTSKVRGGAVIPEINGGWILDELDSLQTRKWDPYQPMSEKEISVLKEVLSYWDGKALFDKWKAMVPQYAQDLNHVMITSGGHSENGHHLAHSAVDYKRHLEIGSEGTVAYARERLSKLDCSKPDDFHQYAFWNAVIVCHEGLIAFAERYADLAEKTADEQSSDALKKELEELAARCRKVPRKPAGDFREAVQSAWLLYVALMIEGWGAGMSMGRMDQYLYPYYKKDIELGKITPEEAQELIEMLLIKMNGAINLQSNIVAEGKGGYPVMMGITIGGVTPSGEDAVNELSYLILKAERNVGLTAEDIVVRINKINPPEYVKTAISVAKDVYGKLKFVSDETTIQSFLYLGLPIELARDYISAGCHCPNIPAYTRHYGIGGINHGMLIELALNNGVSRVLNRRMGPVTGDARMFTSYKQVEDAYKVQFDAALDVTYVYKNADIKLMEEVPCVLQSSLFHGCLEKGVDINQGGTLPYYYCNTSIAGAANVGDSLAAIKKVVFEDKKITMDELIDAIECNFKGHEVTRKLLSKAPKFGNDDDYVDLLLKDVLTYICDKCYGTKVYNGVQNETSCLALTVNIGFGKVVGALPDGRPAGKPLAEGGISPYQGRNTSGVTATLKSVAKLDQVKLTHGSVLNVRVDETAVADEAKLKSFAAAIKTFCDEGGNLAQFNFSSNEMLRKAQEHPEDYRDLLVRVATYSAYFVELSRELQEDIISRIELK